MYNASALFKEYCSQSDREFNVKAIVNGVDYLNTSVVEFDVEDSIIPSEDFTIGTVITSRLTIKLRTSDTIATNAKIQPFVQMNGTSGITEWVPLGTFYIDTRSYQNSVWTFVCYDKLILSQQTYVSALTYPVSMQLVWNEICAQLGYASDSSVKINSNYQVPYKDEDITIHDMLGYIASAHGASVRMTKDEKVAWVSFSTSPTRTTLAASDYFTEHETNPLKTYTALKLTYNTVGETLTTGSGDADHTLSFYNPYMTQAMLDALLPTFNGFSYLPYTMDWRGYPYLEIGDSITITRRDGTTYNSLILTNKASYKGGLKVTSTAPSYSPQRSETDYKGSIKQQIAAAGGIKEDTPYYGVTIGRKNGLKITRSDGVTEAIFNSDLLQISKNGAPVFFADSNGDLHLAGVLEAVTIKAGQVIGDQNDAILKIGVSGGSINTGVDTTVGVSNRAAIRLVPGSLKGNTSPGYIQVLEDGSIYFYKDDGTGIPFAYIKPDGTTNLISTSGGSGSNYFIYKMYSDVIALASYLMATPTENLSVVFDQQCGFTLTEMLRLPSYAINTPTETLTVTLT